ncbi:DMT family transporter [Cobetia marina]|uniref:DMT family transporter n=1 Tax=Cobetia marina TaxID=28258 RepID=UPI001141AFBE|nr:DMT family transporter [Cobetia marina]GED42087.1 membrane protein [Cobetia marina]
MSPSDALRLVLLSTLWGMSFIFMRVAAPEFGPTTLILLRMGIGALVLAPLLLGAGRLKMLWEHKGSLAVLGLTSQALPFCLLALATTQLEAGFTSLINATTPLFTALLGMALFATPIQKQQYLGLAVAFSGVYVLSSDRLDFQLGGDGWFILAALGATFCYGFASNFSRQRLSHLPSPVLAAGSSLMSSLLLLIPGLWMWPQASVSLEAWGSAIALAVLSTSLAFLIFFRLLASAGATATTSVTFLVPVSALLWGNMLLDEVIDARILTGMGITLLGTAIATRLIRLPTRQNVA